MKTINKWLNDMSLKVKIVTIAVLVGIVPSVVVLLMSVNKISKVSAEKQTYSYNRSFEQVQMAISDKMTGAHNISTLLAVSDIFDMSALLSETEGDISGQLSGFEKINSYSYGMEMAFDSSEITYYIDGDYVVVNGVSGRFKSLSDIEGESWYRRLMNTSGGIAWIDTGADTGRLAIARTLCDKDDYSKITGVIVIALKKKIIESLLLGEEEAQVYYVESATGELFASSVPEKELVRLPIEDREYCSDTFEILKLKGGEYLARAEELQGSGIYLVSVVPKKTIKTVSTKVAVNATVGYVLLCAVLGLMLMPIVLNVTRRLQILGDQMSRIDEEGIRKIEGTPELTGSSDEIGQLITLYNDMVDEVEALLKAQYELGEEKKGAELKALQSQINPHFLYNTLDMINWMAAKNETDNIRDVIQAMSRFYRLTLSKGADNISIRDELVMCENYMEIQNRRFRGKIRYEVNVEENALECLIPKITLQPFLENAIIHGICEKDEVKGTIRVDGWVEDGRVYFSVTDDGVGMKPEDMYSGSGSHYGMKNIEKRLAIFFGEEIPIKMESTLGVGTCIMIDFPAVTKEEGV